LPLQLQLTSFQNKVQDFPAVRIDQVKQTSFEKTLLYYQWVGSLLMTKWGKAKIVWKAQVTRLCKHWKFMKVY